MMEDPLGAKCEATGSAGGLTPKGLLSSDGIGSCEEGNKSVNSHHIDSDDVDKNCGQSHVEHVSVDVREEIQDLPQGIGPSFNTRNLSHVQEQESPKNPEVDQKVLSPTVLGQIFTDQCGVEDLHPDKEESYVVTKPGHHQEVEGLCLPDAYIYDDDEDDDDIGTCSDLCSPTGDFLDDEDGGIQGDLSYEDYEDLYSLDRYYTPDQSTSTEISSASELESESEGALEDQRRNILDDFDRNNIPGGYNLDKYESSRDSGGLISDNIDSLSDERQSTSGSSYCDCVSVLRSSGSREASSDSDTTTTGNILDKDFKFDSEEGGTLRAEKQQSHCLYPSNIFTEKGDMLWRNSSDIMPSFCVPRLYVDKSKAKSTSAVNILPMEHHKLQENVYEDSDRCKSCDILRSYSSLGAMEVPRTAGGQDRKIQLGSLSLEGIPGGVSSAHRRGSEGGQPGSPRSPGFYNHRILDMPQTIMDVNYELLQSGIAILPGCRDHEGCPVVFIFTSSSLWQHQKVSSIELARVLLYYRSVPREEVKTKGLKIVADIRGASTSTMNTLLETLYLFQGNCPGAVSTVYMITDEVSQALVTRSPLYDPMATFRVEMLSSVDLLKRILSMDQLPVALDGYYTYNHEDWMRYHMKLDPFISKLRSVAKYLVCIMQDLSDVESMPGTARETSQLIEHHEQLIKSVFEDQRVASIQTDGEGIINTLKREELHMGHSVDYRDSMDSVNNLYDHLQTTMVKLVRLSDSRLSKLEQCLQLQEFEEECTKVIVWVQGYGEDALKKHAQLADNLKAVRSQQKDFEKFHFTAMTHIEKGNDLLEEASMLAQSGNFDEVTGYKELARTLKKHLQDFTGRLEDTRERIESTTKCYHLLDKTYEWALDAMKYVASMKMEHCATADGLDKLLRSLELYLRDHPVMKEETFVSMLDLAQKLRNEKLVEQSRVAKARCEETHKLLCLRQSTMQQAKEKMLLEIKTVPQSSHDKRQNDLSLSPVEVKNLSHSPKDPKRGSCDKLWPIGSPVIGSPIAGSPSFLRSGTNNNLSQDSVWRPQSSSTPSVSERPLVGYASSGSSVSSPISVFDSSQPFLEHGESIITEDMSNRIVTSIPKILNDTTLRSSREDLTSPGDISVSSTDSSVVTLSRASSDASGPASAFSSNNRPCKKVLKRTSTAPPVMTGQIIQEEHEGHLDRTDPLSKKPQRHDGRTVSMITSSTDSLTSLPEEIEDPETSSKTSSSPPKEFSPVPVNTHLSSQNRNIPTGSLADLKLTGTEKTKRTLAHVMREMVQTERDYVCSLQYIIHNYVPELQRDDVPQALRGKRNVIFGNLEKIYQFHRQYFLREVEMCENNPFQIAHYFLMHGSQFYLYALYNKNKPKSDSLMAEYGKYFFREKQCHLGDKMDLSSYLLKPVQRMGKYALLLKQIMKACPHSEQEYQDLKAAEEMVKFQLRHGNDLLAMDSLKDCDVNLQEQGRLLRQDEFLVWQGRKKSMRHVFLFEDMILFSKTRRGRNGSPDTYHYKFSFKMADVGLTESYGESGYKFEIWFRRRTLGENYILQAQGSEIKHAWVKEISRILWKQALKNRDNHLTEMATMGVGNKPCLDIKPSANNIQDRYINFAVSGRGARTRNSIAVTSFEHLRQGNKRPHSIISVSSTSSSSSSHSGLGPPMFAALPPGFESTDSPRCRQSIACMSNESGIGTDISSNEPDKNGTLEKLRFDRGGAGHARNYSEYDKPKLILSSPAFTDTLSTDV